MHVRSCSSPIVLFRVAAVTRAAKVSTAGSLITCRNASTCSPSLTAKRRINQSALASSRITNTASTGQTDIFQLAGRELPPEVSSIFSIASGSAGCTVTPTLINKFGLSSEKAQTQTVVSVTNRLTNQQAWFNKSRTQKPQLFQHSDVLQDPTVAKRHCDFCQWQEYTASDTFGRVESSQTVTASNLFKYCEPCHGLVLFKHHQPLEFNQQQVSELLDSSFAWFKAAQQAHPEARYPYFLWNCLPRAGASQFHGHAQVMLSKIPLPCHSQAAITEQQFQATSSGQSLYQAAVLAAHSALGLVTTFGPANDRAYCYPSLTPLKDMETVIHGSSLNSPSFQTTLHGVLRTLIDKLDVTTFNVGILGMNAISSDLAADFAQDRNKTNATAGLEGAQGVTARIVSRGKLSSQASDFGGLEVFAGASIGHTDPFAIAAAYKEFLA